MAPTYERSVEPAAASAAKAASDAFLPLTSLGWAGGLLGHLLWLTASFLAIGYFVAYWRGADMDFMVVYSALAVNAGKPLAFYDHPGFVTILSVEWWFRLLHWIGLLDAWSLSDIPSATNEAAFDAAMSHAVRAARTLSFLVSLAFIFSFAFLVRRFTRDWRLAMLATLAFAFSGGLMLQARIVRTEMIAACLVVLALLALMICAREASRWRPLVLGLAALAGMVAIENKVHAILLIAALPVVIQPFGTPAAASVAFWRQKRGRWLVLAAAVVLAAVLVGLAAPMLAYGLDTENLAGAGMRPLVPGRPGVVQAALIAWIVLGVLVFARLWRVSATETLTSLAMMAAGTALGLLALHLQYDPMTVVITVNPLEKMLTIAGMLAPVGAPPPPGATGLGAAPLILLDGIVGVLERYTFVLYSSPRPAVFLTWLIFPGIVVAWRRGARQAALQATLLMLAAIGIDALGMQRNLKPEYFNFTDPLIILAGVVLIGQMSDLRTRRFAHPVALTLIIIHLVLGQAEPLRRALKREPAGEAVCEWNQSYMPLLPVPWCELPPKS